MKVILLMFVGLACWGQMLQGIVGGAKPSSAYLFSETFDGSTLCAASYTSNCDHTETVVSGTPTFNYSTSPAPLAGSYSLYLPSASVSLPFSGHSGQKLYIAWMYSPTVGASAQGGSIRAGASEMARLSLTWDGSYFSWATFWYSGVTQNSGNSISNIAVSDKVYIKVEYTPGTGSNAVWTLYLVKGATFPGWGSAIVSVTTATDTANASVLNFDGGSANGVFDNVRISLSDITY